MNRHPFLRPSLKSVMTPIRFDAMPSQGRSGPAPATASACQSLPDAPARRWLSSELLAEGSLAEIQHGDQIYRLRLTSLGKLILTK